MNQTLEPKSANKTSSKSSSTVTPVRIHKPTSRLLRTLLIKANRKAFGKKIKSDDLIRKALEQLTDTHIEEMKEASYDSKDRLEIEYQRYCKQNGSISKNDFLAKLLEAGVPQVSKDNQPS